MSTQTNQPSRVIRTTDRYTIQTATNRKGPFLLCVPKERLSSKEFATERVRAKGLSGWYSRKWGTTPGGFGFHSLEHAEVFAS